MAGPAFQQPRTIAAPGDEHCAKSCGLCGFGQFSGQGFGAACMAGLTGIHQRADATGGFSGCADCGAQVHHGLCIITGPKLWR